MKRLINKLYLIVCIAMMLTTTGCVQHDGYIGDWFGSWHLEEILIDGEQDAQYAQNREEDRFQVMISFQGKIFNIGYVGGSDVYGTWSEAGEILTLIINDMQSIIQNSPNYNPFPVVMHFPADVDRLEITVTEINSKTMQWQYINQNGNLLTYNFRKYP